jgi:hypothetical protein
MVVISTNNYSPYGIACIRCNDRLIAPNWSEYVSERNIRHSLVLRKLRSSVRDIRPSAFCPPVDAQAVW